MTTRTAMLWAGLGAVAAAGACGWGAERRLTDEQAMQLTSGGVASLGRGAIKRYGCRACHDIRGVEGARALVGPPLDGIGARVYIGGVLPNTPENMMRWIMNPPAVDPKTAMPNLGVTALDARDIAAYLYTLR